MSSLGLPQFTPEQKRQNLLSLAEFLEQPGFEENHKVRFDMDVWSQGKKPVEGDDNWIVCETAACMTGYATIALGIPRHNISERWEGYCCRVLIPVNMGSFDIWNSLEYRWMFDSSWGGDGVAENCPDNTPKGGAARIRYYLANGCPERYMAATDVSVYADRADFDKEAYTKLIKPYHVDFRNAS